MGTETKEKNPMIKQGKLSFRWILLSRILLLTVPVLLVGQYVTYRKARSTLLETARQNLTESAGRQVEVLENSLEAIEFNLVNASENYILRSGNSSNYEQYIDRFKAQLPAEVSCVQLRELETERIVAGNCGATKALPANLWPQKKQVLTEEKPKIYVNYVWPKGKMPNSAADVEVLGNESQISLALSAPVYTIAPEADTLQLRYVLSLRWQLPLQRNTVRGSLSGSTVAIDEAGNILAHPNSERVGRNIIEEEDVSRLETILRNALAGNRDFIHLFSFENDSLEKTKPQNRNFVTEIGWIIKNFKKDLSKLLGLKLSRENELLAGYAATSDPIATDSNNRWVILAITPLEYALSGLEEIQQVLLNLIIGLIAASIIAAIYLARTLALPLEKLRDYAVGVNDFDSPEQAPKNIEIQEFNQLAQALNNMVERLKSWAEELEKASKEANIANELKSDFLTNISHELRTPLNGIIGSIQLILDGFCDDREEEVEYLHQGQDSAMHLLAIVNDLLDLRKIESGAVSIILEETNLTEVLFEAIAEEEKAIAKKGLKLNKPSVSEEILVDADPDKLKQVFSNVLDNAIKFTEAGSITISVEVERVSNNNYIANVYIEDTGIGMDMTNPESQRKKLFGAFQGLDGGKTKRFGGMGLGLTVALHIIEAMRGSIAIDSEGVNKGAKVTLSLPVKHLPPSFNGKEAPKDAPVQPTAVE